MKGRRIGAWVIDIALLLLVAAGLGAWVYADLHHYSARALPVQVADAILALLFSGGNVGEATHVLTATVWHHVVAKIQLALVVLVGFQFVYQYVSLAWKGRTLGKALADVRVHRIDQAGPAVGGGRSATRAALTTAVDTGLYAIAWMLLLHGSFALAFLVWLLSITLIVLNGVLLLAGGRSLVDRLSGTQVIRTTTHQVIIDATLATAQVMAEEAKAGAHRTQAAMQRALESPRGQQAQELGRRVKEQVRTQYEQRRAARQERPRPPTEPR